jgi:hypothetical protein
MRFQVGMLWDAKLEFPSEKYWQVIVGSSESCVIPEEDHFIAVEEEHRLPTNGGLKKESLPA